MGFRTSAPAQNLGYNRTTDWPMAGGGGMGPATTGGGMFSSLKSSAAPGASTPWHPTIGWMLGLVIAEMFAFAMLSRHLKL